MSRKEFAFSSSLADIIMSSLTLFRMVSVKNGNYFSIKDYFCFYFMYLKHWDRMQHVVLQIIGSLEDNVWYRYFRIYFDWQIRQSLNYFDWRIECRIMRDTLIFGRIEDQSSSYRIFQKKSIQSFYKSALIMLCLTHQAIVTNSLN